MLAATAVKATARLAARAERGQQPLMLVRVRLALNYGPVLVVVAAVAVVLAAPLARIMPARAAFTAAAVVVP